VAEEATINMLLQYGIAGVVIYLLFRIVFNDLASIKQELAEIKHEIRKLREVLERNR
jgi:hypothetical protein